MVTLTSNEQAQGLVKDGILKVKDDIEIAFDGLNFNADLICHNIYSKDYKRNITARNINAAGDMDVGDIDAAGSINAWDITAAGNIDAEGDISAGDISATGNIRYYAVCFAYENITCKSIKGSRKNAKHFCLDGKITLTN